MIEMVNAVREAEAKAEELRAEGRRDAKQILADAEVRAAELIGEARADAENESADIIRRATEDAAYACATRRRRPE